MADSGTPPARQDGQVMLTLSGGETGQTNNTLQTPGLGGDQGSGQSFTFPVNPEEVQITQPARMAITQTLSGAYQDHFGAGVAKLTLAGNTGWRGHGSHQDGFQALLALRGMHEEYLRRCGSGDPAAVQLVLTLATPEGFGSYRISSDDFRTSKSTRSPLLFRYEIQATVLQVLAGSAGGLTPQNGGVLPTQDVRQGDPGRYFTARAQAAYQDLLTIAPPVPVPYVVQAGDTLASISQQWFGTRAYARRLALANRLPGSPTPGVVIQIPVEPL